jgi:hypothetical protein
MTHLVTYHTPDMSKSAELCKQSALKHGVDKAWQWTRAALEQTEFFEQNKEILNEPRGAGLWCWKPYIILDALDKCRPDDILIYSDAGVEFIAPVTHITKSMGDIWLFGNMYEHQHWCKADVMNDIGRWPEGKQCQASVIFVKPAAQPFIEQWLGKCKWKAHIDDSPSGIPNHPEFKEHRHDQAILTTLAYKKGISFHWWPATYNNGAFNYSKDGYNDNYPVLFHHHRKRNHEW